MTYSILEKPVDEFANSSHDLFDWDNAEKTLSKSDKVMGATIVLVHGAWHGGWCWRKVKPLLQQVGHTVFTPSLMGMGEHTHMLNPQIDLQLHIQDIVALLEYSDRSVVRG